MRDRDASGARGLRGAARWQEVHMGERAQQLAARFEQAVEDFAAAVEACPEDVWRSVRGPEGWTVAAAAQHVSGQFPLEMEYVTAWAEGKPAPAYTWADVNAKNDARAAKNTNATKADVLKELRASAPGIASYIRGLNDEQLDRKMGLPLADGAEVTTEQVLLSGILIDHLDAHRKATVEASTTPA
jgi:hypothetical protein